MELPLSAVYLALAVNTAFGSGSSWSSFFLFALLATAAKFFYNLVLYPSFFTPLKHIPTPPNRSWLTGNSDTLLIESPFKTVQKWSDKLPHDGLLRYYLGGNLERVAVTKPKVLSELLVTQAYHFEKPPMVRQALARVTGGHGVLLVEGDEHKKQRRNLMPAFAYRHIKNLYPVFWAKSTEMAKLIEADLRSRSNSADNVVCVRPWASRATLDIIGVAGMDHDFESLRDPHNELTKQYEKVIREPSRSQKMIFLLGMVLGQTALINKLPTQRNRDLAESSEFIRSVARQMIREKKGKLETHAPTGVDIISVALESGGFTEEELVDQMMTFLGAGHETTATSLQWAVYTLCKHPDIQTRLRAEVRANLPSISTDRPEPLNAATLDALPYLHAFCNEVLRHHPSVPSTIRISNRATTLAGTPIPKGTLVTISPEVVNHSTELWGPDAHEFNPDRWMGPGMANSGGASSNYAFLTFIHGPRSCIGQGFAKAELACLVAAVVGRFSMSLENPNKKLEVRHGATISPRDGVLARFVPLEGW